MTMIAVRPEDRAQALSPLERKKARKRLVLDQKVIDSVAASSVEYLMMLGRKARD